VVATTPKTNVGVSCALALAFVVQGCSGSPAQERAASSPTPKREAPALKLGALHELVPAAGLRWMVVGQPRKISENADLSAAVRKLLPQERLTAFAKGTAVDLTTLPNALAAGFDLGTLYLAELPDAGGHRALERFVERQAGHAVIERPHPRVVRSSGTVDGIPHSFVDLDGRVVGVSIADLTLARVPIAFATGKLKKTVPALRGAALSTLPPPQHGTLLTFYAPGPFDNEWARGARGILAASLAASISLAPANDGFLRATLTLAGDWEQGGPAAAEALRAAFDELVSSPTGKLFAFERARAVSANFSPQYLTLSAELPLDPLVRGLRAAVIADVWEILDLPPPQPLPSKPTP
jgi:hypothetical protein